MISKMKARAKSMSSILIFEVELLMWIKKMVLMRVWRQTTAERAGKKKSEWPLTFA